VIEVENNRVGLTTIDTRMSQEVVVCEELAGLSIPHAPLARLLQICRPVKPIVLAPIGTTTITAIAPPRATTSILIRKVFKRFP